MNTIEYQTLSQRSRDIGDAFYKCLSSWLADPSDAEARRSCLKHGHDYEKALIQQIEYLKKLKPTPTSKAGIDACQMYYTALESQLQLLDSALKRGN